MAQKGAGNPPFLAPLDTQSVACAESPLLRPDRWDWLEVREYLVLKYDGTTEHFPVLDGEVDQARLRASLVQRPEDYVVAVTEDAFISLARAQPRTASSRPGSPGSASHPITNAPRMKPSR